MVELSPAAVAGELLLAYRKGTLWHAHPDPFGLAFSLEALANQVAPSDADEPRNNLPALLECQRIRSEILAIAAELRGGAMTDPTPSARLRVAIAPHVAALQLLGTADRPRVLLELLQRFAKGETIAATDPAIEALHQAATDSRNRAALTTATGYSPAAKPTGTLRALLRAIGWQLERAGRIKVRGAGRDALTYTAQPIALPEGVDAEALAAAWLEQLPSGEGPMADPTPTPTPSNRMTTPTPADRLSHAVCDLIDCTPECSSSPELCRQVSAAHCARLAQILRERHGGSSQVADWLDGVGANG